MNQRSHAGLLMGPMFTRRSIIFGPACAVFAAPATAADAAPLAFVTSIYDAYKGKTRMAFPSITHAPSGATSSRRLQP
ncbi:MAG: hypothetical protein WBD95_19960 [Xanthobacteraceae bacterium]